MAEASILRPDVRESGSSCHGGPQADTTGLPLVAIVGSPNVGKSVLFNTLTGAYVTVSNYPGTTVEIARGKGRLYPWHRGGTGGQAIGVIDTPGMYRLIPVTEEERVARDILLYDRPALVIHVVDAKNLERMLPMTLELIEAGEPVILVVNFLDEAERLGVQVDLNRLETALGIPVIGTALALGRGAPELKQILSERLNHLHISETGCASQTVHSCQKGSEQAGFVRYHPVIETALARFERLLHDEYPLSRRALGLLLLQEDPVITTLVMTRGGLRQEEIQAIIRSAREQFSKPLSYLIAQDQRQAARVLLNGLLTHPAARLAGFAERLSATMMNPWSGLPILIAALFLLYEFVGVLGAQILVNYLENDIFGSIINPWVDSLLASHIPWQVLRDLIGGEYGLITLGIRYAIALILPIVGTFFLVFSIIEDSGYLPRLAMLIDRVFKKIGLNGRAVIPMVLGLGCDTMATIVTRTLETRRERFLSTLLLALAIPCSAQLGVMLGLLANNPVMMIIWSGVVTAVFLLVGMLTAKLMPGERPTFYMEIPPLRMPKLSNVFVKTYTRLEWYFREVLPMFLIASVIIWLGKLTGFFDVLVNLMLPLIRWLGLPDQAAVAFLFGFFRRDYGAAGLYDLRAVMNNTQILVAAVTMTLFVPCVAQFSVTIKERGWKTALGISGFIFPFAFLIGGLLNWMLATLGLTL